MKQFQIQIYKGHPIINDGENRILIDTGGLTESLINNDFKIRFEHFVSSPHFD